MGAPPGGQKPQVHATVCLVAAAVGNTPSVCVQSAPLFLPTINPCDGAGLKHASSTILASVPSYLPRMQVLRSEVLPALSEAESRASLRALAGTYRRAAATAPPRPHTWLLNTDTGNGSSSSSTRGSGVSGRAGRWVSAAAGAAGGLVRAPFRAGVVMADAAADAAHFGVGARAPLKA